MPEVRVNLSTAEMAQVEQWARESVSSPAEVLRGLLNDEARRRRALHAARLRKENEATWLA